MRRLIFVTTLLTFLLSGCAPREFIIYSESMLPTIENGETVVVVARKPRISELSRYDLVAIEQPTEERSTSLRRAIAFPGEKIRVRETAVYVNGEQLDLYGEIGVRYRPTDTAFSVYGIEQDYTVPPGKVFVLGDNFALAKDSRVYGPVPEALLIATVRKKNVAAPR